MAQTAAENSAAPLSPSLSVLTKNNWVPREADRKADPSHLQQ